MTLIRKHTWRTDLSAYIERCMYKEFEWGKHDCALFAAGAIYAMTGEDIAESYRGRYSTALGGARVLKKEGFSSHIDKAASILKEIPKSMAAVGDIATVLGEEGEALGVVNGERIFVLMPSGAIGSVSLLEANRAFRV